MSHRYLPNGLKIAARLSNEPGQIIKLVSTIASQGARIMSFRSDHDQHGTRVLMITENHPDLQRELERAGFPCETRWPVLIQMPPPPLSVSSQSNMRAG